MKLSNSFRHQADIILFCKGVEKWAEQNGRVLGHDINYTVEASAMGAPLMEMKIPLRYGFGIDNISDLITHAINWELIQKSGSWFTIPFIEDGDTIKHAPILEDGQKYIKFQGEDKIRNWLLVRPEQVRILEKTIREKVFG
jgi:hypothetical protein